MMKSIHTACMVVLLACAAPTQVLLGPVSNELAESLDLNSGTVQVISLRETPHERVEFDLVLHGDPCRIVLERHALRAHGFELRVADASGIHTVPTPRGVTYRGSVLEHPKSAVAATIRDGRLRALVTLDGGEAFGIQPLRTAAAGGDDRYVVYARHDLASLDYECGVTEEPEAPQIAFAGGATRVVEIACEADYAFYQKNGNDVDATHDDILLVMAGCDLIYERDATIQIRVKSILVRTSADPYSTTTSGTLLSQFRSWWNANQTGTPRDLAHLFTGRNLDGNVIGVAYLSVVCSSTSGYGLSESRYTSNVMRRIGLTAHELGHNWSAGHCNNSSPCWIMCPSLGGCDNNVTKFAPVSITAITNHKNSRSCLSVPYTPTLSVVSPATVGLLQPDVVTLVGNEFQYATSIDVGNQALTPSAFHILDNHTIRFVPPAGTTLGAVSVVVNTPAGPTNAQPLTYAPSDPPVLDAPTAPTVRSTMTWQFASHARDDYYLAISADGATALLGQSPVLLNVFVFAQGRLDTNGLGSANLWLPPQLLGVKFHSQVAIVDNQLTRLRGVSNIVTSTVK